MVQAICHTALAPLADGLGGHAIALGEDAGALVGAGDLGTGDGRGAGVRMDLQHRSDLPLSGLDQTVKQVAVGDNSMPHRIPTMFRNLTARRCSFNPGAEESNWMPNTGDVPGFWSWPGNRFRLARVGDAEVRQ